MVTGGTVKGRPSGFYVGTEYVTGYNYYGTTGQLQRVTGEGLDATYGAVYSYVTDSSLPDRLEFRSSTDTMLAWTEWEYEFNAASDPIDRRAVRSVENGVAAQPTNRVISNYTYTNGYESRRNNVTYSGEAFTQNKLDAWSYNDRQELTATAVEQPVGTSVPAQARAYAYDPIGNRTQSTTGTANPLYYCVNSVNQYSATDDNTPSCPSPAESFGYDDDVNMTQEKGSLLISGNNRLRKATPRPGKSSTLMMA